MTLSDRIMNIKPSATMSISGKAKMMKAAGLPVISFSAGEPDFATPACAQKSAIDAINRGESHYTINAGIAELRREICIYYKNRFNLDYEISDVLVSSGAKPILYMAMQMLINPGDEVLVFAPAWVSYVEQIHLAGGKESVIDTVKTDFIPTREAIEEALSDKTVGVIINSPSNPTGVIYSEETLRMIADVARKHNLWVITDEIYERFAYEPSKHIQFLNIAPDLKDRTLIINRLSKAYAMTGWRVGYALGPEAFISKLNTMQTHLTSNASSIAQWAAYGAMRDGEEDVLRMKSAFEKRRSLILGLIKDMPYVTVNEPQGAFYVFLDIRKAPLSDDMEFCTKLLDEKYVAAVPGTAFFTQGFVRFSYACSDENIVEGMKRLKEFLEEL